MKRTWEPPASDLSSAGRRFTTWLLETLLVWRSQGCTERAFWKECPLHLIPDLCLLDMTSGERPHTWVQKFSGVCTPEKRGGILSRSDTFITTECPCFPRFPKCLLRDTCIPWVLPVLERLQLARSAVNPEDNLLLHSHMGSFGQYPEFSLGVGETPENVQSNRL